MLSEPDAVSTLQNGGKLEVRVEDARDKLAAVELRRAFLVVVADQRQEVAAENFVLRVAHELDGEGIREREMPRRIARIDDVARAGDEAAEIRVSLNERHQTVGRCG